MLRHVAFWGASAAAFGAGVYAAATYTSADKRAEQNKLYNNSGTTPREDARALFNKWASSYDSKVAMDERLFLISRLRKKLVSNARGHVLEVGAGSGRNQGFYPKDVSLTLVDYSEKMLEQAKKKAGTAPNIQFQVADAHQLPFADESFDTVVDTFGLCTFEKPHDVLAEMQRVCKDDGQILLLEHGKSSWDWLTKYLDDRAPAHAHRWGCWWNRDIDRIVKDAGLTIVRESRHHLGTNYVIVAKPNKHRARGQNQP